MAAAGTMTGIGQVFASTMPAKEDRTNRHSDNLKQSKDMEQRNLGGMEVSAIGLGCLPMVGYYGGKYEKKDMITLIRRAYDRGVTLFDTAEVYGPYTSEKWVGEAVAPSAYRPHRSAVPAPRGPECTDGRSGGRDKRLDAGGQGAPCRSLQP